VGAAYNIDDLVGAAEIADRLGLTSTSVIHDWRHRHADFPAPVKELRMGLLWSWPSIEAWAYRHRTAVSPPLIEGIEGEVLVSTERRESRSRMVC